MLGEVGANIRAIFLKAPAPNVVTLWFFLEEDRAEDRDSIESIVVEFQDLLRSAVNVDAVVTVDTRPSHEVEWPVARAVFVRREQELEAG